jgi:hypothetical protein
MSKEAEPFGSDVALEMIESIVVDEVLNSDNHQYSTDSSSSSSSFS